MVPIQAYAGADLAVQPRRGDPMPESAPRAPTRGATTGGPGVGAYRFRMILAAPGTPIQAFDQDDWARALKYDAADPHASLALFDSLRAAQLRLWRGLNGEELDRTLPIGAAELGHRRPDVPPYRDLRKPQRGREVALRLLQVAAAPAEIAQGEVGEEKVVVDE